MTTVRQPYAGWCPPATGVLKLNVDGSCKIPEMHAGAGALIRDHTGKWRLGFMHSIGVCSILESEL